MQIVERRVATSSSDSCVNPVSFVRNARSIPLPLAASLWADARSAFAASDSAWSLDMPVLNWSSSTPYIYGLPEPVAQYVSGIDPPAESMLYTLGPEGSTPTISNCT